VNSVTQRQSSGWATFFRSRGGLLVAALLALVALVSLAAPAARAADAPPPIPASTAAPETPAGDPADPGAVVQDECAFATVACVPGEPEAPAAAPGAEAALPGALPGAQPGGVPGAGYLDPRDPNLLSGVARDTAQAASTVLTETFGWFLRTSSLPLESDGVLAMQATMLGLAGIVLTLLVIVQGIRMTISRRGAPFAELVSGMVVASIVIVAGVALIDSALLAGDRIAAGVISLAFPDSDALVARMVEVMLGAGVTGQTPVLLLVFALLVLTAGFLQAVLLFLRQCAIPLLGAVLPVAAVGQAGPAATQRWLPRLLNLTVAIVLYKPVVALILSLGFVQFSEAPTLLDAIRGSVTLALSIAAFPVLLRLFAPASNALAQRGGSGLAALGPLGLGSTFAPRGAGTPGDTTAVQHAAFMQARGPAVISDGTSPPTAEAPSAAVVAFPRSPSPPATLAAGPSPAQPVPPAAGHAETPVVVPLRAAQNPGALNSSERSRHGQH
jgi:hypothetical protein